ncbi:MAG: enoyl-CoA hydratase/isomerase family protein [SAR324 cluster bacterium]|nr:enoyl-CoA hydratase/isomerase family protein [SAR324 cluster bacterium]
MNIQSGITDRKARLNGAGLDGSADPWLEAMEGLPLPDTPDPTRLEGDAQAAAPLFAQGWELLERLPLRSGRNTAEKAAGEAVMETMGGLVWRFCRAHRRALYDSLTDGRRTALRVDELVWRAAQRWPGLLSTKEEIAREAERMQIDKDGREISQGLFLSQVMSDPACGTHLLLSMLQPTAEARARLEEFIREGAVDLGAARVEARGETGYVYFSHPRTLNAMDDETLGPEEVAIDLVLLHPGLCMGVLRGEPVTHPKYAGRRIFSSGINLTKIYNGKVSYLFYLLRDMGLVNKIYRGLAGPHPHPGEPEQTEEKPWMAVVDTFAIGGGCQLLLVVDYVIAEAGAYFNLPARKEGIIPGAANMRLPRFMGERLARQAIMFDKTFYVEEPEARTIVNEVHPPETLDAAVETAVANAVDSGMVSAGGNRKAIRVETEPLEKFREYMATYAREQAFCHLSEQLIHNLEKHWQAKQRKL